MQIGTNKRHHISPKLKRRSRVLPTDPFSCGKIYCTKIFEDESYFSRKEKNGKEMFFDLPILMFWSSKHDSLPSQSLEPLPLFGAMSFLIILFVSWFPFYGVCIQSQWLPNDIICGNGCLPWKRIKGDLSLHKVLCGFNVSIIFLVTRIFFLNFLSCPIDSQCFFHGVYATKRILLRKIDQNHEFIYPQSPSNLSYSFFLLKNV